MMLASGQVWPSFFIWVQQSRHKRTLVFFWSHMARIQRRGRRCPDGGRAACPAWRPFWASHGNVSERLGRRAEVPSQRAGCVRL